MKVSAIFLLFINIPIPIFIVYNSNFAFGMSRVYSISKFVN